jgi:hypothetical protein
MGRGLARSGRVWSWVGKAGDGMVRHGKVWQGNTNDNPEKSGT